MPNSLRLDPTRTTLLRKRMLGDMRRRFRAVSQAIEELVVKDDAFGLKAGQPFTILQQVPSQAWRFKTSAQKVTAYRKWLDAQVQANILTPVGGISGKPWTATYIESAYKKGAVRAYADLNTAALAVTPEFYLGGQAQFLKQAFGGPEVLGKIELLYTRAFDELKGVTAAMGQQMSRVLAEGLAQGYGASKVSRELRRVVSGISKTRGDMIARTEIIRAHAEGQLDSFDLMGVKEVGLMAEWSTAGDRKVCPECDALEAMVMPVSQARGLLPRHPSCRCAWIPADPKIKVPGQKKGTAKSKALAKSIQAEAPKKSFRQARLKTTWAGKERLRKNYELAKPKPKPVTPTPKKAVAKVSPPKKFSSVPLKFGSTELDVLDTANKWNAIKVPMNKLAGKWHGNFNYLWDDTVKWVEDGANLGSHEYVAIARQGEKVTGHMFVQATKDSYSIEWVAASKSGEGQGSEMVKALYKRAIKENRPIYVASGEGVEGFYAKLGFKEYGRASGGVETPMRVTVAEMKKQLAKKAAPLPPVDADVLKKFPKTKTIHKQKMWNKGVQEYRDDMGNDWGGWVVGVEKRVGKDKLRAALRSYVGTGYREVNEYLRKVGVKAPFRKNSRADRIRTLIREAPVVKKDTILYRFFDRPRSTKTYAVGKEVRMEGFVSTSSVPTGFASSYAPNASGYEILIRKGQSNVLRGFNEGEFEFLFDHGAKFRVLGRRKVVVQLSTDADITSAIKKGFINKRSDRVFKKTLVQLEYLGN